jgi:hypothetical protein
MSGTGGAVYTKPDDAVRLRMEAKRERHVTRGDERVSVGAAVTFEIDMPGGFGPALRALPSFSCHV